MLKNFLIIICLFSSIQGFSQEEFFRNETGLSVFGSSDFLNNFGGGLSFHFKDGFIVSASGIYTSMNDKTPLILTAGYLFDLTRHSETSKFHALLSISNINYFAKSSYALEYIFPTLGFVYTSFKNENYQTSFGLSASTYIYNLESVTQSALMFNLSEAFFPQNKVYPVIGFAYGFPIFTADDYQKSSGSVLFNIGLNVRL